ncbi:hypothetical protein PUR49_11380 [Streptomyces sp. BE147]|uniref:hypothetical protein n=1 Tax=Streptomyces sp. BE147 TaxID=3002524 RepID=UPI002E7793D4|nr:hypothetical protein [Streptomyces sp. BE147]MEE1737093.1 hypothetical protein [Streptomyces sp. BE147]
MIPRIPPPMPMVQGPVPPPPPPDLDGYPKYSFCLHCGDVVAQSAKGARWVVGNSPECPEAPNPDDGPMPGHMPGTVLHPPRR